jgi:hypothetical protein
MKSLKFILAGVLLSASICFGQGTNLVRDPCGTPNATKQSAIVNITTATTTEIVPLSGTTNIFVCAISLSVSNVATTANTWKLVHGTGVACATGTTDLTGAFGGGSVVAAAPSIYAFGPNHPIVTVPAGNALCITTTIGATAFFRGVITYIQQ